MKSTIKVIVALAVLGGAGHGAFWYFANQKAQTMVQERLDELLANVQEPVQLSVQPHFESAKYPKIGVQMNGVDISLKNPEQDLEFKMGVKGNIRVSSNPLKAGSFSASLENVKNNASWQISPKEGESLKGAMEYQIASGSMKGVYHNTKNYDFSGSFSGIKTSVAPSGESKVREFLTLDELKTRSKAEEVRPEIFNYTSFLELKNIRPTFAAIPLVVENYTMDISVENVFEDKKMDAAFGEIEAFAKKEPSDEDVARVSGVLKNFVERLAKEKTTLSVREIGIKAGTLQATLKGAVGLGEATTVEGGAELNVKGFSQFLGLVGMTADMLKQHPLFSASVVGDDEMTLQFKVEHGVVTLNEVPLTSIPALSSIVVEIPAQMKEASAAAKNGS